MNQAVAKLLERLGNLEWFANCGQPLDGDFLQVTSLKEAHKYYADSRGMAWENSKLAVMNRQGELAWGEDIFDWMVLTEDGRLFGGFTLRVSRSKLPESRRADYDRHIGVRVYEPAS